MSARPEPEAGGLEAFAAALAHELRTPLAALSGEVDIALRRERSAAAYRDALARIAASVAELIELTGDLTFLGEPQADDPFSLMRARFELVLARAAERHASTAALAFAIDPAIHDVEVAGDEGLLTRAVSLVLEHAVRHRRGNARLTVRAELIDDPQSKAGYVQLRLQGDADAFWPQTWQCLAGAPGHDLPPPPLCDGPLRLRTAERIVRRSGGLLYATAPAAGATVVHIRLRVIQ